MAKYSECWKVESIGLINTWRRCDEEVVFVLWDPWKQNRPTEDILFERDNKLPCKHCTGYQLQLQY